MSFGTYARKVADSSLPYGRRINALAGCVERYSPIGYPATFAYLEQVAGPFRRDEAALVRALDMLVRSRRLWLAELNEYATGRRSAKRLGRRNTRATDDNPGSPVCWYGDAKRAAIFAIGFTLEHGSGAGADAEAVRLALSCLETSGELSFTTREHLEELRQRFRKLRRVSGWPDVDWPNWRRANDSMTLLHHVARAADPGSRR